MIGTHFKAWLTQEHVVLEVLDCDQTLEINSCKPL